MLNVFDIQRFALHDGPGIRTTIFVKGCPLNCLWCHNPESKKFEPQLSCIFKNCVSCGNCVSACPNDVHTITNEGVHEIAFDKCQHCGSCVEACYNKALKIFGTKMDTDELMKIIVRDRSFYEKSNGGLTVSGGEPMSQFDGTLELFKAAKNEGLHTCLDTSGFARKELYEQIMPYVDVFLFDYKLTDCEKHQKYTGVPNDLIKSNMDMLCKNCAVIFLRCPIIPGINDDDEHLDAIAALSRKYDAIAQVNVMAYHDMAKGKIKHIGGTYALEDLKTVDKTEKQALYDRLEKMGCLRLQES
jgi:pyruvate formate lyase activating enzyme